MELNQNGKTFLHLRIYFFVYIITKLFLTLGHHTKYHTVCVFSSTKKFFFYKYRMIYAFVVQTTTFLSSPPVAMYSPSSDTHRLVIGPLWARTCPTDLTLWMSQTLKYPEPPPTKTVLPSKAKQLSSSPKSVKKNGWFFSRKCKWCKHSFWILKSKNNFLGFFSDFSDFSLFCYVIVTRGSDSQISATRYEFSKFSMQFFHIFFGNLYSTSHLESACGGSRTAGLAAKGIIPTDST